MITLRFDKAIKDGKIKYGNDQLTSLQTLADTLKAQQVEA